MSSALKVILPSEKRKCCLFASFRCLEQSWRKQMVCTQLSFVFRDFHCPSPVEWLGRCYKHPKLFFSCNGYGNDRIASWAVHVKNHASDHFSPSLVMFLMSQDRNAVGMRACSRWSTPVLENHWDGKALVDKIRHVFIVIYRPWTRSIAQSSNTFGYV